MELFIRMAKQHGTTVIMVTHEPTIAAYADREIIVRDGQIAGADAAQHTPTAQLATPRHKGVAQGEA